MKHGIKVSVRVTQTIVVCFVTHQQQDWNGRFASDSQSQRDHGKYHGWRYIKREYHLGSFFQVFKLYIKYHKSFTMCLHSLNYYWCVDCHWLIAWSPRPIVQECPEKGTLQCVPLLKCNDFDFPSTGYKKCIEKEKEEEERKRRQGS